MGLGTFFRYRRPSEQLRMAVHWEAWVRLMPVPKAGLSLAWWTYCATARAISVGPRTPPNLSWDWVSPGYLRRVFAELLVLNMVRLTGSWIVERRVSPWGPLVPWTTRG